MSRRMSESHRPNILWICTDQQRFDTLGCYGNPFVRTPNLDRLAARGMLMERAYCQNPLCTPSRASFLTGRYPRTNRCRQNGQSIAPDERLVTRLLRDAGYRCGLSGKLHVSACHPSIAPHSEPRIDDGYEVFEWSHHPAAQGSSGYHPGDGYSRRLHSLGREYRTTRHPASAHVQRGMEGEYHHSTWCADRAVEFIEAAGGRESRSSAPWLFSVNFFDPHHPFDPPPELLARYEAMLDRIPLPDYRDGEEREKSPWLAVDHNGAYGGNGMAFNGMTDTDHRLVRGAYWAMCDFIDVQVGKLLDALDRTGQHDDTLVIFTSDHGELLGDHGAYLKGPHFYECAIHVPLIVSMPGVVLEGVRSKALVELVDLAPTILDVCGLERDPGMQGRSMLPYLEGSSTFHRDDVYCEFYNSSVHFADPPFATMVRNERFKIVRYHGSDYGELYDLERDPSESTNLWSDPASSEIRSKLLLRLCDRMAETADPLPLRDAPW